uniref:Uncharacterized protein n=1 Tax=Panagrolaimus superbus TaxID=310955 RepID=A0A914Y5E3_9BILA
MFKAVVVSHEKNGAIRLKLDKHSFIFMSSGLAWLDVFSKKSLKPDFWLSDVIPDDVLCDSEKLKDIEWFSNPSVINDNVLLPSNVHFIKTDEVVKCQKDGIEYEIWNIGVGWIILSDNAKILFIERAISSDKESWPNEKQNSKLWKYSELRDKFGIFDLRIVDFTSKWVPTDSGEMFEYDCTKKTAIIYSSNLPHSMEAFDDFKRVLQFSEDLNNYVCINDSEEKMIELL